MTNKKKTGGLALASVSTRDFFASTAPITFGDVVKVYGSVPDVGNDLTRACFFSVWSLMKFEYADAMMAERKKS